MSGGGESALNPTVRDHFLNPRNVGQIPGASGTGEAGDAKLGTFMRFTLRVEDGIIREARFKTLGCSSAIASSSVITELITGHSLAEAERLKPEDVVAALDGLPGEKWCYPELACDAVRAAVRDCRERG